MRFARPLVQGTCDVRYTFLFLQRSQGVDFAIVKVN